MRSRLPIVFSVAILVLLQANPAINWLSIGATARAARAAQPSEASFVDSYVDSAMHLVGFWSVLSLIAGVTLLALSLLVSPGRRWARTLLTIGLGATVQLAFCGVVLNTGSPWWTGPDQWDTIEGSVPAWQSPALWVADVSLAIACAAAIIQIWRRPPRTAQPQPPDPTA